MRHVKARAQASTPDSDPLREGEQLFRLTAESFPHAIVIYDAELRIRFINSAGISRSGLTEQELLGRTDEELNDSSTTEAYMPALRRALETGTRQTVDITRYTAHWFVATQAEFLPVLNAAGEVTQIIGIALDISDRKRFEMLADALGTINAAINSTLDIGEIMSRALDESSNAIGADTGIVTLREDDHWVVGSVYAASRDIIGNLIPGRRALVTELAASARDVVAITDAAEDPRLDQEAIARYGIRSILAIPLIVRDQVTGAIVFRFKSRQMVFREVEIDFARKLSACVSLALENARLFEDLKLACTQQRQISDTLRRALVPTVPEIGGGYRASAICIPASDGEKIGGDFLDVFRTEAGWIGLLIGDVSGKGIRASYMASSARSTVRAFAYEMGSPGRALRHANAVLLGAERADSFATVFLAVVEPDTGLVRYSGAGHPPAVICRPDGSTDLLSSDNPPLAFADQWDFTETEDRLEPGSRIVFYTDGLSEARSSGAFFGIEGIREVLVRHKGLSADELTRSLIDAACAETPGQLGDDTAIMVLDCIADA